MKTGGGEIMPSLILSDNRCAVLGKGFVIPVRSLPSNQRWSVPRLSCSSPTDWADAHEEERVVNHGSLLIGETTSAVAGVPLVRLTEVAQIDGSSGGSRVGKEVANPLLKLHVVKILRLFRQLKVDEIPKDDVDWNVRVTDEHNRQLWNTLKDTMYGDTPIVSLKLQTIDERKSCVYFMQSCTQEISSRRL